MRNRVIHPEFWSDEKLAQVSRDARLLFIGLWGTSDDYGVSRGDPLWLKGQLFPYDMIKKPTIESLINELVKRGFISRFVANGEGYIYIKNFKEHQRVDHPSKFKNPEPPDKIKAGLAQVSRGLGDEVKLIEVKLIEVNKERGETKSPRFTKPTIEQVQEYIKEKGYPIDAQRFFDSNEAKGWVVGKFQTPMKNWQAAVRTWVNRRNDDDGQVSSRRGGPR